MKMKVFVLVVCLVAICAAQDAEVQDEEPQEDSCEYKCRERFCVDCKDDCQVNCIGKGTPGLCISDCKQNCEERCNAKCEIRCNAPRPKPPPFIGMEACLSMCKNFKCREDPDGCDATCNTSCENMKAASLSSQ
ncbi:hypothetical protein CAPTEDRAFT_197806 [Capitella teleta]|uniref:WAP domain-containing protein n=1 Tax=Capitella teleta TaxID=283909 RepID=R7TRA9_CAPTE|nr:hypothetical protein CAPTEDRAFT_197806 [Capitella teleta]|eukprot:ELT94031.1 hypothetical protein CAPTEDRAFT_197806 [Capitella teleta]